MRGTARRGAARPWLLALLVAVVAAGCPDSDGGGGSAYGSPAPLPLPSQGSRQAYQQQLYAFLGSLQYRTLGWKRDKGIRDSGPYRDGNYYGTHPAVRVYYSPEVMTWLVGGRRGAIADGGMIIKEM